ncbi:MAG: galactokinase [Deltaproteobacteria bacterium]|nr:MAG: galactokinase [Deltaproteobacteria bacterium]
MSLSGRCIREVLERNPIKTSAPCRIDSGGTWDIKALALPLEGAVPVTVNLAIDLRTYVTLLPFKSGWVKISSDNLDAQEAYPFAGAPFNSQFGLFFAIASFFRFHGFEAVIRSSSPIKAGLGGSSTAAVAAINALSLVRGMFHEEEIEKGDILHLAYHLEDAVNLGMCGLQDQGAAVYGGVNKWVWNYSRGGRPFERESILDENGQREISKRLLVAYSGRRHLSARINRLWIEQFLGGKTRSDWIELNRIVDRFALHIKEGKWKEGAKELRNEVAIRREITPEAFTPIITRLIKESEGLGCGARFAGAGGGGAVWALGEIDDIRQLREIWAHILKGTKKGGILECAVDPIGVREEGYRTEGNPCEEIKDA